MRKGDIVMSDIIRHGTPAPERHGTPSSDRSTSPISHESTRTFDPYRRMSTLPQGSITESPPPSPGLRPSDLGSVHLHPSLQSQLESPGPSRIENYRRTRRDGFSEGTDPNNINNWFKEEFPKAKSDRKNIELDLTDKFFKTNPDYSAHSVFMEQMRQTHDIWNNIADLEIYRRNDQYNASLYEKEIKKRILSIFKIYENINNQHTT
jgi:hypothetical protein